MARARVTHENPIWLPGRGDTDLAVWRVQQAVTEYDERLVVGRNEDNGQWCVYIRCAPGGDWPELFPVLGLTQPPHDARALDPHDVVRQLWSKDAVRQGEKLLDDLNIHNQAIIARGDERALEAAGMAAEGIESVARAMGRTDHRVVYMHGPRRRAWGEYS